MAANEELLRQKTKNSEKVDRERKVELIKRDQIRDQEREAKRKDQQRKESIKRRDQRAAEIDREERKLLKQAKKLGISVSELIAQQQQAVKDAQQAAKKTQQAVKDKKDSIEKLKKIPGMSQRMADYIMDTYTNSSEIGIATEEELRSIPKVSKNIAAAIKRAFPESN